MFTTREQQTLISSANYNISPSYLHANAKETDSKLEDTTPSDTFICRLIFTAVHILTQFVKASYIIQVHP